MCFLFLHLALPDLYNLLARSYSALCHSFGHCRCRHLRCYGMLLARSHLCGSWDHSHARRQFCSLMFRFHAKRSLYVLPDYIHIWCSILLLFYISRREYLTLIVIGASRKFCGFRLSLAPLVGLRECGDLNKHISTRNCQYLPCDEQSPTYSVMIYDTQKLENLLRQFRMGKPERLSSCYSDAG